MIGPQPPRDLRENLPAGMSPDMAYTLWVSGHKDGYLGAEYFDLKDLQKQPLYSEGYEQGEKERLLAQKLNSRKGAYLPHKRPLSTSEKMGGWVFEHSGKIDLALRAATVVLLGVIALRR